MSTDHGAPPRLPAPEPGTAQAAGSLRDFLRTEAGAAAVLVAAVAVALAWANISAKSYETAWHTAVPLRAGALSLSLDLRDWVNSGLMTLFFFVVGLEARRELDLGELRERRRLALPVLAGLAGMAMAVGLYLAVNAGQASEHGWGTAMSTDSAVALGVIALVGPRHSGRLRSFILSISVVDELASLAVIGVAYSRGLRPAWLAAAGGILAVVVALRAARVRHRAVYPLLGIAAWVAAYESGVDPVLVGLVMGLLTYAHPAARADLERATESFRGFREQPTPELARSAGARLASAISPNERLQHFYDPWTSYLVVPVFMLANAGITITGGFLARAAVSPITLGILIGCVAGKPLGVAGAAWLAGKLSRGRIRPPVGWAFVVGAGAISGIGFTISLLVAALAFSGEQLAEAKAGILAASLAAAVASWAAFRLPRLLPARARALAGASDAVIDLDPPVDPDRDHIRGRRDASVTVVEYGDFECPYCGLAERAVTELLAGHADVRFVWRHLPLSDIHPRAELAAEAAEAAAAQGAFWPMHDRLVGHQGQLRAADLMRYAADLGLDVTAFGEYLRGRAGLERISEDVDSADASGVSGTPTFFVNGRRLHGGYDVAALSAAIDAAAGPGGRTGAGHGVTAGRPVPESAGRAS
jgi:Na+/H+ antiporter NhaA